MTIKCLIETPKNSKYQYEVDAEFRTASLKAVLTQKIPYNFGHIPFTKQSDGSKIKLFVISSDPISPGTDAMVDVLYGLRCDDNGVQRDVFVGVLNGETNVTTAQKEIIEYLTSSKTNFTVKASISHESVMFIYKKAVDEISFKLNK